MGVVYRAFDTHLDRPFAIKVLRPGSNITPEQKRRSVQEAKAASALNHPNIIHVYDADTSELPDGPIDFKRPLGGGDAIVLDSTAPAGGTFGFSTDSAMVYVVRRGAGRRWELAAFAVPGGEEKKAVPLDVPVTVTVGGFSMHPDGTRFASTVITTRLDIWLLEGFPQPRTGIFGR